MLMLLSVIDSLLGDFAHDDRTVVFDRGPAARCLFRVGRISSSAPVWTPAMWQPAMWPKVRAGPRVMPAPGIVAAHDAGDVIADRIEACDRACGRHSGHESMIGGQIPHRFQDHRPRV